jgi:hypothetical protein
MVWLGAFLACEGDPRVDGLRRHQAHPGLYAQAGDDIKQRANDATSDRLFGISACDKRAISERPDCSQ